MQRNNCRIFQVGLQSTQESTQEWAQEFEPVHAVTHPGAALNDDAILCFRYRERRREGEERLIEAVRKNQGKPTAFRDSTTRREAIYHQSCSHARL